MGYHVTKAEAEAFAANTSNYVARPYPDRHGDHTNNFKPRKDTWGVWNTDESFWVFVGSFTLEELHANTRSKEV